MEVNTPKDPETRRRTGQKNQGVLWKKALAPSWEAKAGRSPFPINQSKKSSGKP